MQGWKSGRASRGLWIKATAFDNANSAPFKSPPMLTIANYRGLIPAIACPFTTDHRIDEPALRKLAAWLAEQPGIVALMTNGHTG